MPAFFVNPQMEADQRSEVEKEASIPAFPRRERASYRRDHADDVMGRERERGVEINRL